MNTTTEQERDRAAVRELGQALVHMSLDGGDHGVALQALLLAYVSIAAAHPCCIERAADAAQAAVFRLRAGKWDSDLPAANVH